MNHAVIGKRLTKRFGNQGAKRIHKWIRDQYARVSHYGDNLSLTLDAIDTDDVYGVIERYIDCFHDLKPADFVRWFRLSPVLDRYGRPRACVDVKASLYSDIFSSSTTGECQFKEAVLRGTDLIDLPSRSHAPTIQQRPDNEHKQVTGAVVSIAADTKIASLLLPEQEALQILSIYQQTRYRCNPLSISEWNDVLLVACYRRLLSTAEAMPWVRNMPIDTTQSLDMLVELDSECYQQHEVKTDVRHPLSQKIIASATSPMNPSALFGDTQAVLDAAERVRKSHNLPKEGFDYISEERDSGADSEAVSTSNLISFPGSRKPANAHGEFENMQWGDF